MVRRQLSRQSHYGGSSTDTAGSDASGNTRNTAPSAYSEQSLLKYFHDRHDRYNRPGMSYGNVDRVKEHIEYRDFGNPRSSLDSANTYTSTCPSEQGLSHDSELGMPLTPYDVYASDAIPSTPADFTGFFPSNRRLLISHDDATSDGNMNLRVDTIVDTNGHSQRLILFHLQMHDLRDRHFSFRRYCRESGRQICSSSCKNVPAPPLMSARVNVQQSLGKAFQQLRLSQGKAVSNKKSIARLESGHDSTEDGYYSYTPAALHLSKTPPATNGAIQLTFSNYAHIDVNKRGSKRSKRYEYEFWGTKYEWKCYLYQDGNSQKISYHLVDVKTAKSIAHITPDPLTAREAQEEEDLGGWVPPCTMQITDRKVFRSLTDVADTIVATGLIALVDDCIDRRWHSKRRFHLDLPRPETAEYISPERLIDQIFNRVPPTSHHRCQR